MRHAPSVSYPVGRSPFSALLRSALWLAGAGAIAAWIATGQVDATRVSAAAIALAACGCWAGWSWWREPAGTLAWDGARWTFSTPAREDEGSVRPALDLQSVLLVRWDAPQPGWFWLDRRSSPRHWDALRRAVHSAAFAEPAGAGSPEAAP
jgi:hypothetical protein